MKPTFWLFCTVIDNFGDIGVSWRLANALSQHFHAQVHLWLDDFRTLNTIAPNWKKSDITLHAWQEGQNIDFSHQETPQLIIETFACTLPENVVQLIAKKRILWLNWEYLSAEDWAEHTHAMRSLQSNGAEKYFWQMGFSPKTGGLLREKSNPFPQNIHKPCAPRQLFLFGYESEIWAKWFRLWQETQQPFFIQLADTKIANSLIHHDFLPKNAFENNAIYVSGSLKIEQLPFAPQHQFDEWIQAADMVLIRGEDSFVRAQYTGKPFLWHIYPQENGAHRDKLNAFWRLPFKAWQAENDSNFQAAFLALSDELNGLTHLNENDSAAYWQTLFQEWSSWQNMAQNWRDYLLKQTDAMTRLAAFLHEKQTQ